MSTRKFDQKPTVCARLGPTNTGKTHYAIQRMLGYRSGVFGLPLRLLAREVYDRVVRLKGEEQVALVTGEEKILAPHARYFICTTECMPRDRTFEFLALDEVQLAAHPQRGHVFTDRILHFRGEFETLFLGAATMENLLRTLVPEIQIDESPRLSELQFSGYRKLTNLPKRSAVVGFSAESVIALAERLRAKHGGAGVVMGALSPRTRNAQVQMYENGDVDYLVATDAIGMGLNLDVHHVALASQRKFDGVRNRILRAQELAQIAGRAGRYHRDGTFGSTASLSSLEPELVTAVVNHRFEPVQRVYWRSTQLNFQSLSGLQRSLETRPTHAQCIQKKDADDHLALSRLALRPEIAEMAGDPHSIALLWEVCGIPDFSHALPAYHSEFLGFIFKELMHHQQQLPEDVVAQRVQRLNRDDGNIETLMARIGAIRTWTFIANRAEWLKRPQYWQEKTQAIEDRISDALHLRLTERFVDKRASVLNRWLPNSGSLTPHIDPHGRVTIGNQRVAEMVGLHVVLHGDEPGEALARAIRAGLMPLVNDRVKELLADPDTEITWRNGLDIVWRNSPIATLQKGSQLLAPRIRIHRSDWLDGTQRNLLQNKLQRWISVQLRSWKIMFQPSPTASPQERAILYGLETGLGFVERKQVLEALQQLSRAGRRRLKHMGVHFGHQHLWMPLAMDSQECKVALWIAFYQPQRAPTRMEAHILIGKHWPPPLLRFLGYRRVGRLAIRVDILEQYRREPTRAVDWFGEYATEVAKELSRTPSASRSRNRDRHRSRDRRTKAIR
jgi:ATP-dependent RNA helicase SUPV3L1/SUV3